ncbi:putative dolichyl-diphosphooligosaccharide--protein glycosyltransferase subunit 3B [Arachis hypogaea]|nr:putative dolichyl-diphosphooligosaccharide--protein glycosyltransferase subunit 3B [Arachis hypogaea]
MAGFVKSKTKISVVGLLLAFISQGLVKMKNVTVQMVVMMFPLLGCFLAEKQVVFLNNWKTGYGIHGFWPSS